MNFRKLRHRIDIQSMKRISDGMGGGDIAWTMIAQVWSQIIPLNGSEFYDAQQTQAPITHKIIMRYREGVKPDMRIVYDGRFFEIQSVINVGELDKELQLMCRELV